MTGFRRRKISSEHRPEITEDEKAEVREELQRSQARYREVNRRWPEVRGIVDSLIEMRAENHFRVKMQNALTGENQ